MLTPGDYGGTLTPRLTITQSISITNDGTGEASILAPASNRAVVVIPEFGAIVSLRGLVIDGLGAGEVGIDFEGGAALHIQNCVIRNFEADGALGVWFDAAADSDAVPDGGEAQLFISDTIIFNNGKAATTSGGIRLSNQSAGSTKAVLDRVHVENNVQGMMIDASFNAQRNVRVIVRDSVISGNAANGIHALTQAIRSSSAFAVVEGTTIVNNRQNGILADGPGATLLLSDSTVARNGVGISTVNSGQLISYRNNRINNNIGPDGAPTSLFSLK